VRNTDRRDRLVVTGLMAALAALLTTRRPGPSDFGQVWAGARFLLQGYDPYTMIGPGRAFEWDFPLYYPLPALLIGIPFAWLPLWLADATFAAVGAGVLAWTISGARERRAQFLVFVSFAFVVAAATAQWSLLLTAAALTPALGWLLACKPTLGLAYLTAWPSGRSIVGAAVFGLITVAIWPWWVSAWLSVLSTAHHILAPVTVAGGPIVLIALLKWRRPEARLLVALACVPHTPVVYEAVPLFLVVERPWEGVVLAALSVVTHLLQLQSGIGAADYAAWTLTRAQWQMWLLYLPCLLFVMRRPNIAPADDGWATLLAHVNGRWVNREEMAAPSRSTPS
jgi:hypothetical protein